MLGQVVASLLILIISASSQMPAQAQTTVKRVNQGTVGVLAGHVDGTGMRVASDLAWELNQGDELRILPIQGHGSIQAIADLLYLQGIDIAILQRDAMEYSLRKPIYEDLDQRLRYITKLFNKEIHIVARRDIGSIRQLEQKRVNIGLQNSGADLTSLVLFEVLGITIESVQLDHAEALDQLLAGELAAMIFVDGQPASILQRLVLDDGLHLLPVDYTPELLELYLPAKLESVSYPGLIPPGGSIDTVAVEAIMAVYDWPSDHPRYEKVARFVDAFFNSVSRLQQPPRHSKWMEVRLDVKLPGWERFTPAADWLKVDAFAAPGGLQAQFEAFLAQQGFSKDIAPDLEQALLAEFAETQGSVAPYPGRALTFALVPTSSNNAFFSVANQGCLAADSELPNVECLYVGPGEYAEQEQAQLVQNLIDQGIDGIALSPGNPSLLAGVLRRAKEADIPVITWAADLLGEDSDLRRLYIGSDNYQMGVRMAEMGQVMRPAGGSFCIMAMSNVSTNINLRMDGLRDTLAGDIGIARLTGQNGWTELSNCPKNHGGDVATAMDQLSGLLRNYAELDAIFSVTSTPQRSDLDFRAVTEPYRDRIARGQPLLIMADALPMQMDHLVDGLSHAQIGQRPFEMGYRAMYLLKDLVEGRAVPEGRIIHTDLDTCTIANVDRCLDAQ